MYKLVSCSALVVHQRLTEKQSSRIIVTGRTAINFQRLESLHFENRRFPRSNWVYPGGGWPLSKTHPLPVHRRTLFLRRENERRVRRRARSTPTPTQKLRLQWEDISLYGIQVCVFLLASRDGVTTEKKKTPDRIIRSRVRRKNSRFTL